jgi:membrane protein implicated in regulation of membrane protease activity
MTASAGPDPEPAQGPHASPNRPTERKPTVATKPDSAQLADPAGGAQALAKLDMSKQFEFARDSVSHVLTLSTAVLAISLTFSHDWVADTSEANTIWLKVAWCSLVAAIVLGLWAMLSLTGLAYIQAVNVGKFSFRLPWMLQILAFLLGLVTLLIFGWMTVNDEPENSPEGPSNARGVSLVGPQAIQQAQRNEELGLEV